MKISLVTTVKNETQYADMLISSILSQTQLPDEWIVVDGGSDDDTVEKFKAISLCTVIEHPCNRAHGRNIAIEKSTGDVVAVTDVGCLPGRNWLEELVRNVRLKERQIAAGKTICRIRCPFDAAQHTLMDQFVINTISLRKPAASCRSLAFHRQAWRDIPFPEWLDTGEDSYLLTKWREKGWSTNFVQKAKMEWIPPQSFGTFMQQYFRYIRGEGQAALHINRHLLRITFYILLALLSFFGGGMYAVLIWLTYFSLTSLRLFGLMNNKTFFFKLQSLLWIFPALFAMDMAKTCGFIAGSLERLFLPKFKHAG